MLLLVKIPLIPGLPGGVTKQTEQPNLLTAIVEAPFRTSGPLFAKPSLTLAIGLTARLHLDVADVLGQNPTAGPPGPFEDFGEEVLPTDDLLVTANCDWAEWLAPGASEARPAENFGRAFADAALAWIRTQQQHAEVCVCLSWLEVVAVLRTEGAPFPAQISSPGGNLWRDPTQFGAYSNVQPTVVLDLQLVRAFFRAVASEYQVDIGETRRLNLSPLKVGPPESGLSICLMRSALVSAERTLLQFTASRPVRSANDLSRPMR